MHRKARLIAPLLCATSLCATPALGLTVLQAPLSELVKASEYVLHGTIAKVEVLDLRRHGRGVWTEFSLRVHEAWKGARKLGGRSIFKWRLVGGTTKDGMTVSVPGMPTFVTGEEVVVLLEKHSTGHTITGAPQGKFHVEVDKMGHKRVRRDLLGAHIVRRDPRTGRLIDARPRWRARGQGIELSRRAGLQTLGELRAEILGYVKARSVRDPKVLPRPTDPRRKL